MEVAYASESKVDTRLYGGIPEKTAVLTSYISSWSYQETWRFDQLANRIMETTQNACALYTASRRDVSER